MSDTRDTERHYVSPAEFKDEIDEIKEEIGKLPTRWEVRTLILLALVAGRFIPSQFPGGTQTAMHAAHAAIGVIL